MRKFVNSLLVICAVTAVSCGSSDKSAKSSEAAAEVVLPKVEVTTVASRDVVQQVIQHTPQVATIRQHRHRRIRPMQQ